MNLTERFRCRTGGKVYPASRLVTIAAMLLWLGSLCAPGCSRRDVTSGTSEPEVADSVASSRAESPRLADTSANSPGSEIAIRWPNPPDEKTVSVVGLDLALLDALRHLKSEQWASVFAVSVKGDGDPARTPAMIGAYSIRDEALCFEPAFPWAEGVTYQATFDPARAAALADALQTDRQRLGRTLESEFTLPAREPTAPTFVTHVYPSAGTLPENQLKLYVHFSAPMSRGDAYRYVHLFASDGGEVDMPFLELDEELWDPQATRFTLFFDPGRIKRGLKPREEVGPILEEGKNYVLVIDREWPDARGNSLKQSFRRQFRASPPDDVQPDPDSWQLRPPHSQTRDPLVIKFPEPLDHAMLHRVLTVADDQRQPIDGTITVVDDETQWSFTPQDEWESGRYQILVQTNLEDLAGNSIARPFEVDVLHPIQRGLQVHVATIEFQITRAPRQEDQPLIP